MGWKDMRVSNMEVASELMGIAYGCVKERNNGK